MKVIKSSEHDDLEALRVTLAWDHWMEEGPVDEVRGIVARVRAEGDAALVDLTRRYDGVDLGHKGLSVGTDDIARASRSVEPSFADAVRAAARAITAFHRRQEWESIFWDSEEGARIGQIIKPLSRVGIYIPGGNRSYPSTAMMTVIPAKVAGVPEIAACVPPSTDGEVCPHTLYTLHTLGVDEVYRVGGAQAIAAMAYGTETIRGVDKVAGPGNIYVTLAKREVLGRVGIDMLAGPSELVVLADAEADADCIALEMLAQMEHGSGARACLISTDEGLVSRVAGSVAVAGPGERVPDADRAVAVIVEDLEEGIRLADILAPEHLMIATDDLTGTVSRVHNAGAVFLGTESPVALGDYAVGVNHVLPTKGAARHSSPLGVYDFLKRSNIVFSNPKANRALGPAVEAIASVEGFAGHAEAMRKRYH